MRYLNNIYNNQKRLIKILNFKKVFNSLKTQLFFSWPVVRHAVKIFNNVALFWSGKLCFAFICFSKIQQIISSFCSSLHVELQQRGVEFTQLFGKHSHLRPALLERMPPMEAPRQSETQTNGDISDSDPKSVEDSPEHIISNSESVRIIFIIILNAIFLPPS